MEQPLQQCERAWCVWRAVGEHCCSSVNVRVVFRYLGCQQGNSITLLDHAIVHGLQLSTSIWDWVW